MQLIQALEQLGGLASRRELIAAGVPEEWFPFALAYARGKVTRVRHGWYALPTVHPLIVRARRAGGVLACVSAVAYYAARDFSPPVFSARDSRPVSPPRVHILVPAHASRLSTNEPCVVHYTRRAIRGRLIVSRALAEAQAATCRHTAGATAPCLP